MARTDTLRNFLTDVASAIKTKKGSDTIIPAANFDTEILSLPSQGTYQQKTIQITQNGTIIITPDENYDAIDELSVTVAVPDKPTETKYITPGRTAVVVTPTTGKTISRVEVSAVDRYIDSNIIPENIREGVHILGVTGIYKAVPIPEYDTTNLIIEDDNGVMENDYTLVTSAAVMNDVLDYYENE